MNKKGMIIIGALLGSPLIILIAIVLLVVCILSPASAYQTCVYGEGYTGTVSDPSSPSNNTSTPSDGSNITNMQGSAIHDGMTVAEAKAWYGGQSGPNNVCATYPEGQCTYWACMRSYNLGGIKPGPYWGNGGNWAASGQAAGYQTTRTAPVPGSIVSFPGGVQGADPTYGHVAIVESVDRSTGRITISEMNVRGSVVSFREIPVLSGAVYILPDSSVNGAGNISGGTGTSSGTVTATKRDDGKIGVNVAASSRPAECSADGSPFVYTAASSSDISGKDNIEGPADPNGLHASAENAKKYAKSHLKDYGWNDLEFTPLELLWTRESSWQWNAENAGSGAYGIPQCLGHAICTDPTFRENAYRQVDWGLQYIKQRYGSPSEAWRHSERTGWY